MKCPERPALPETDIAVAEFLALIPEREAQWDRCIRLQHRLVDYLLDE
ncbi:MAG: hypothetical protein ACOC91_03200 [bacterium]